MPILHRDAPALFLTCLLLSACGGGGGDSPEPSSVVPVAAPVSTANALSSASIEGDGGNCAYGGSKIQSGVDSNANGRLDSSEVTGTQYTCHGAAGAAGANGTNGTNGQTALVAVSLEAPGSHCASGGNKVDTGLDRNGNGALGADEIVSSQFVCNGISGTNGTNGATGATGATGNQGLSALVQMSSEPAGGNCAAGGKKVNVGVDGNANQVLEPAEISSSAYICNGVDGLNGTNGLAGTNGSNGTNGTNGANGVNGTNGTIGTNGLNTLLNIVAEAAGANCTYGGSKVSSGLDSNANGVLEAGEVAAAGHVCNGAPGSNSGMSWWTISASTVQAQPNSGYIAGNNSAPVVVTLPTAPAIGDTVRISGAGLGGWTLAQNAGQLISTKNLGGPAGLSWTARDSNRNWRGLASSTDGAKLVAVVNSGQIYTSTDSGASWTARDSARNWYAAASSADGTRLAAVVYGGQIYTSTDSGISWTARDANRNWNSIAMSADGSKLVATVNAGNVYTSIDYGISWTVRDSVRAWQSVASSADGLKLVAAVNGGQIYTSINAGVAWTARATALAWFGVASSTDGVKLVGVVNGGQIWTSTDSGATWLAREAARNWQSVTSSADGSKLVAAVNGGQIYSSVDSGVSWTARATARSWNALASSADGTKLAALVFSGQAYTSVPTTSLGSSGYLTGVQYDAIELQYLGNGVFCVLSHEGSLIAY